MSRIVRRLGTSPRQRGSVSGANCPDVLKTSDGNYLVIGEIATRTRDFADDLAGCGASIGPHECAVTVPADVIEAAARDIVEAMATRDKEKQLLDYSDFLTSVGQTAHPLTDPVEEPVECYRCLADERAKGVINISLREMYPPDHADHCTAKDAPTP